jgi:retinoid hydroxylase
MTNSPVEEKLPPGSTFIGETLEFFKNPTVFASTRRAKYGDVYLTNILGTKTVNVAGTAANQWVFSGEGKYLTNRWIYTIRQLLGKNSLAMINGEEHRKRRAMLTAHFKYENMSTFAPAIHTLAQQHLDQWTTQGEIKLADSMRRMAFEIIAAFLFGEQRKNIDLIWLSSQFTQWTVGMFAVPISAPFTTYGKAAIAKKAMFDYIANIIDERRKNPTDQHDILNALLNTRDDQGNPLPLETIIDDIQLLLFAGHDTTVSANTNLMVFLAQHPEVLAKARAEQEQFTDADLTDLAQLKDMPYLDAIIHETLRMVPPVAGLFRQTITDTHFGGYKIPQGYAVNVTPASTQSDPALWDQPQNFCPERFERNEHKREPFQHIPFGGGQRLCIGQNFAMIEMRIIIATAIRHYDWSLVPDQDLSLRVLPLPLPKSGGVVTLRKR